MENTDCTTRNDDKESLLRFLQDADCLDSLSKWTNEFNIFDVLGVSRAEIRHSNMLGWLLDPNENHGLGDSFLYGIISKISQNIGTDNALHFLSSDLNFKRMAIFADNCCMQRLIHIWFWHGNIIFKSSGHWFIQLVSYTKCGITI